MEPVSNRRQPALSVTVFASVRMFRAIMIVRSFADTCVDLVMHTLLANVLLLFCPSSVVLGGAIGSLSLFFDDGRISLLGVNCSLADLFCCDRRASFELSHFSVWVSPHQLSPSSRRFGLGAIFH